MNHDYQFVLQRLREEREHWNLTQRLLCYNMNIQQSHFSRAETGQQRFSYHEIKKLCTTKVDIFYIFTGKRTENTYEIFEPEKASPEELICHLNTIYNLARAAWLAGRSSTSFELLQKQLEYIQCETESTRAENNAFYSIRKRCGYTQQKMADLLGVDIKKLRELEKGNLLPDSEIVWKMYDQFQISPAFLLHDSKGLWNELNYTLDLMDADDRKIVLEILRSGHRLIRGE